MKSLTIYTDGGARWYDGVQSAGWGFYAIDENDIKYKAFGAAGFGNNNHVAEVLAAIRALEFVIRHKPETVQLHLDSEYTILGMNKLHDGIIPKSNVEWWYKLEELRKVIMDLNIHVTFDWVKGHSGVEGNEIADTLATRGVLMQRMAESITPADSYESSEVVEEIVEETDKKKKSKEPKEVIDPIHPLLTGREWFFKTNISHQLPDSRFYYGTLTYEKNKKKDEKEIKKNAGKAAADSHYCLLISKEELPVFNDLNKDFNTLVHTEVAPVLINLDVIRKKDHWKEISKNRTSYIEYKNELALTPNGELVGNVLRPPLLSFRLANYFQNGIDIIQWFENKDARLLSYDITDFFITKNDKGKIEMGKSYGMGDRSIIMKNISLPDGRKIDVQLNAGIDIPIRNQINNIVKCDPNQEFNVHLVIWDLVSRSYRAATIITRKDDIAIYYTGESTYRIID